MISYTVGITTSVRTVEAITPPITDPMAIRLAAPQSTRSPANTTKTTAATRFAVVAHTFLYPLSRWSGWSVSAVKTPIRITPCAPPK